MRLRIALLRVDEIAELQRIANEEDGGVVSRHVPVALFGVKLPRKPARIARRVRRTLFTAHRRKAQERRRFLANRIEQLRRGAFGDLGAGAHERTVRALPLALYSSLPHPF